MSRPIVFLLCAAAFVWLVAVAGLFIGQRSMVFPAPERRASPQDVGLPGITVASVTALDGTPIEVWRSPTSPGRPLALMFHGNGSLNADMVERIKRARTAGYAIAAMEYRGYNGNPGSPSEDLLVADAGSVVAALGREGIMPSEIVLWGHSLGTGVAMQIAANQAFRGLLLEAPFTALSDVAAARYPYFPVALLIRDPFLSRAVAARVGAPTLIVSGALDNIIPLEQGRQLAALMPAARFVEIAGAGHNDLPSFPEANAAISEFLTALAK